MPIKDDRVSNSVDSLEYYLNVVCVPLFTANFVLAIKKFVQKIVYSYVASIFPPGHISLWPICQ